MSSIPPLMFQWDGEAMRPASKYWGRQADEHFVVGERYRLVQEAERSIISHNHEFAWLEEAWTNFRDDALYEQFPSSEHLRKYALIKTGHCTMKQHPFPSVAEAERFRLGLKDEIDEYALVLRREAVVTVYRAVSQSKRKMGPAMFQKSKQDILVFVGDLLGVDPETLGKVEQAA